MVAHPVARKFFYAWIPIGPSYTLHSPRYFMASLLSYDLILPFGIAGAVWLLRGKSAPTALFLLAADNSPCATRS